MEKEPLLFDTNPLWTTARPYYTSKDSSIHLQVFSRKNRLPLSSVFSPSFLSSQTQQNCGKEGDYKGKLVRQSSISAFFSTKALKRERCKIAVEHNSNHALFQSTSSSKETEKEDIFISLRRKRPKKKKKRKNEREKVT